jgi:hypothetical protein
MLRVEEGTYLAILSSHGLDVWVPFGYDNAAGRREIHNNNNQFVFKK